jgi:DNA-binding transcriptional LysR family regulator
MDKFLEMKTFVAVVDAGSFVKASDAQGMSKPAVSRYISDLESRLGVRLLQRTTRRLSLTDEGHIFYDRCRNVLMAVDEAETEIASRSSEASGLVRINAPLTFGILHLAPLWGEFRRLHPKVTLDITLSDRVVDLVEEGFDLAIRIAALPDSGLISRRIATTRMVLCASPHYLAQHGVPTHPSELATHAVIAYNQLSSGDEWHFDGPEGKVAVRTHPCISTNNGDTCRAAAVHHQGIVLQPSFLISEDLASGALVELMPEFRSIEIGIYTMYPTRRHVPPKVSMLVEFLGQAFRNCSWGN